MSSLFFPTDLFPFTDLPEEDPDTNAKDGLLDASTKPKTVPKIFYTNTSCEYWGRSASLIHTSADDVLVPQSDADGNDLGGVRLLELQVPLAKYTGWNLRDPSIGARQKRARS